MREQEFCETANEKFRLGGSQRLVVVVGMCRRTRESDDFEVGAANHIAALTFTFSFAHTA